MGWVERSAQRPTVPSNLKLAVELGHKMRRDIGRFKLDPLSQLRSHRRTSSGGSNRTKRMLVSPSYLLLLKRFAAQTPEPQLGALMVLEREIESATARGDVAFLDRGLADDIVFTHGDAWRTSLKPSRVDTKKSLMELAARGVFLSREVNSQQVEPHGSIVRTTGRIDVKLKPPFSNAGKSEYSVWFVRVYRAMDGAWELVSHRTVAESVTQ